MIVTSHVYSEAATKALEDAQSKANIHTKFFFLPGGAPNF